MIAVADDFGKVRLFYYPVIHPKAVSDAYQEMARDINEN